MMNSVIRVHRDKKKKKGKYFCGINRLNSDKYLDLTITQKELFFLNDAFLASQRPWAGGNGLDRFSSDSSSAFAPIVSQKKERKQKQTSSGLESFYKKWKELKMSRNRNQWWLDEMCSYSLLFKMKTVT